MAQASTAASSKRKQARRAPQGARHSTQSGGARPTLQPGRLVLLVLVLVAAALFVPPLRDFFAQQDRYETAKASLEATRADNRALERQARLLTSKAYIARKARADSMLVPKGTQVFVVKGLPGEEVELGAVAETQPQESSISVLDRLDDLWRTLLN